MIVSAVAQMFYVPFPLLQQCSKPPAFDYLTKNRVGSQFVPPLEGEPSPTSTNEHNLLEKQVEYEKAGSTIFIQSSASLIWKFDLETFSWGVLPLLLYGAMNVLDVLGTLLFHPNKTK